MFKSRRYGQILFFTALLFSLAFIVGQTIFRIEYIRHVDRASTTPPELTSVVGTQLRHVPLPSGSVDACWWIMHTEAMIRSGDWRVRETSRDNAPAGREVHWSSGLMWLLAGVACCIHFVSGLGFGESVQHAALLVGPLMQCGFIMGFALLALKRWGWVTGAFIALALAAHGPLDPFFKAGEADHHGIVTCFALGCVLAALAAGAGQVLRSGVEATPQALIPDRTRARWWMIVSGLSGAAGLWVSTATVVPALGGMAIGALAAAWLGRRARDFGDTEAAPELWRLWGAAGALGSLAFYLLEYAPSHFGWRLEINHPLYALAWLGGGDLLARSCAWLGSGHFAQTWRGRIGAGCSLLALVALPTAIKVAGTQCFVIQDPYLWNLHVGYILEFQPLLHELKQLDWLTVAVLVPLWPLLGLPVMWVLLRNRLAAGSAALLAVALCSAVPLTVLAFFQVRWHSVAQTLWLALAVVLFELWRSEPPSRLSRPVRIGIFIVLVWGLGFFPVFSMQRWKQSEGINQSDAVTLTMRDIAWKLRVDNGAKPINIMSGPTTSTWLAFFGDTQAVGTLYWENLAGLKAAGAFYGAKSADEALRICQDRGITHVVIFSWDAFAQPYARLHHARPPDAKTDDCFVSALLSTGNMPAWLRPISYTMLPALAKNGEWVRIFEVRPEQSLSEALYHWGIYFKGSDRQAEALAAFVQAWNLDASSPATGKELALALVPAGRLDDAVRLAALLPPAERFESERAISLGFTKAHQYREAIAAIRRATELAPNNRVVITELAWLLATADDPAVRDGAEAVTLMSRLADGGQSLDAKEMDALAAAHAEAGNFSEALKLVRQALEISKTMPNDAGAGWLKIFLAREASYEAGKATRFTTAP
jgi:tetratricopeptide (TPR) repeat protein